VSVLGVLIAGGASTRFGAPKALAQIGGSRVIDRVNDALRHATHDCVAIINDEQIGTNVALDWRPDIVPGAGALGGILTALHWASERGDDAILAVGCDMPFLPPALLQSLVERWRAGDCDAVLPESRGPRGVEPLCAVYGRACLPAIERALQRDDRRMISFHDEVRIARVPLRDVARHGDPDVLFFNLNTPESRELAERIAAARP
jgi:molybdopterin-guanine dinucleotide biosynthesis protein A